MDHRQADIQKSLAAAIRNSVAAADGPLFGYALCTDDDVMTLFHVYLTHAAGRAASPSNPNVRFEFWEWSQSSSDESFRELSDALRRWADDDKSLSSVNARFETLVSALAECRAKAAFADDTLLCVSSTDPDEHSQALGADAARRLNSAAVAEAFLKHTAWKI